MSHTPMDAGGVVYLQKRYIQRKAGCGIRVARKLNKDKKENTT